MINIQTGNLSKCHKYLDKMGKINQKSVKNLSINATKFLCENTPLRLKELAQMNCFAAEKVKQNLDKQYGEGNYVVISLGRSISSICELIKQIGANVVHLPLSGLRRNDFSNMQDSDRIIFKEYCETVGLTKENIRKNQNKKYILMDYTYYGRSLDKTYNFLKSPDLLGNSQNFIKFSIGDILENAYTLTGLEKLFEYSRFKDYSMVGKLPVKNISKIFMQSSPDTAEEFRGNINKLIRKLFWFNVFNSLIKNDYKNIFPHKELNAIYNHFLNNKAIRNRINMEYKKIKQL